MSMTVIQNNANNSKFIVRGSVQNSLTSLEFVPSTFIIGGTELKTDLFGKFEISLPQGKYPVIIKADGYLDYNETLVVDTNVENLKILVLPSNIATFKGKLVAYEGYNFNKDTLTISNIPVDIQQDGSFQGSVVEGEYTLTFKSDNYKDLDTTVGFAKGENTLKAIQLAESGDVTGELKSYLKEEKISNLSIIVENTDKKQIDIDYKNAKFRIKDLNPLTIYSILFRVPGYFEREYKITIKQGLNQIFDLKFIENISVLYPKEASNNRDEPNLYLSDLDGKNEVQITFENRIDVASRYLDSSKQKVFFQSYNNNSFKDFDRNNIGLVYSYDLNTQQIQAETTNFGDLWQLHPNFAASKMIQYSQDRSNNYYLAVSDLSGDNKQSIYTGTNQIIDYKISDSGEYVIFSLKMDNLIVAYRYNLASDFYSEIFRGNEIKIYDFSTDGNKVLYYRKNATSGFFELSEFIVDRSNAIIIEENFKGRFYQYLENNDEFVVYSYFADGRENLYFYNSNDNSKNKIISLASDLKIEDVYQESGVIFYLTNKGLYVVDFEKPFTNKIVTTNIFHYAN